MTNFEFEFKFPRELTNPNLVEIYENIFPMSTPFYGSTITLQSIRDICDHDKRYACTNNMCVLLAHLVQYNIFPDSMNTIIPLKKRECPYFSISEIQAFLDVVETIIKGISVTNVIELLLKKETSEYYKKVLNRVFCEFMCDIMERYVVTREVCAPTICRRSLRIQEKTESAKRAKLDQ